MAKEVAAPTPRFSGTFSVFDTPGGGIHVAWLPDEADVEDTQHFEIPGFAVGILRKLQRGEAPDMAEMAKLVGQAGGMLSG